jgi:CDP-4-dehydro-6-deoxyglucose reductase, E3
MPGIHYAGKDYPFRPGESVLDCLLRHGVQISHSCKSGVCQSCLMRTSAAVPEVAQKGLKDTLRSQGCFLSCCYRPDTDLLVSPIDPNQRMRAQIIDLSPLSSSVLRVLLQTHDSFTYNPGQYVTLMREDGLARSYSLASLPEETSLELHIRKVAGGAMSEWLHTQVQPGTSVWLQGPAGNCFYLSGMSEQPLLLAGTGTGLAPLYGIVRDALTRGHTGPIWLFHGALTAGGFYLTSELSALQQAH